MVTVQRFEPVSSLADVARVGTTPAEFTNAMKEFVDGLVLHAVKSGYVRGQPLPLPGSAVDVEPETVIDSMRRAYLAGMAEHLCMLARRPPPEWSQHPDTFLNDVVVLGGDNARAGTIASTPSAFRRRLLFCGPVLEKLWAMTGRRGG